MSRKCRILLFCVIVVTTFFCLLAVYTCTGDICFGVSKHIPAPLSDYEAFLKGKILNHEFTDNDLNKERKLDLEGEDVLVYLHMQKTGGATFGRHLVHNLEIDPPCQCVPNVKKCRCLTRNSRIWLFSRHSTGWMCGLHADWTELKDCVDQWFDKNDVESRNRRRYHFITFLRSPVDRFFSEWQHVRRGATWKTSRLHCNGRAATLEEVPFCFTGKDWSDVSFDEFVGCQHNLAFNRMTRMLANLSKVNCYNRTGLDPDFVDKTLIQSAKKNLLDFAFFGIVEEQEKTQFLFERTFGLRFIENFRQKERTHVARLDVTQNMTDKVIQTNKLDIGLYQYALDLFYQRVKDMEKRLGYTVQEYFDHIRDSADGDEGEGDDDYGDDSGEGGEDEEKLDVYPSESSPDQNAHNVSHTESSHSNRR